MAKKATNLLKPAKGQALRIKAVRDGYRRAGVGHTIAPVDHAHDAFDDAQLAQLQSDPNLSVAIVDAPEKAGDAK